MKKIETVIKQTVLGILGLTASIIALLIFLIAVESHGFVAGLAGLAIFLMLSYMFGELVVDKERD